MVVWRGRKLTTEEQVANACDSFVDLTPADDGPAAATEAGWAAWLPGQEVPLIWEVRHGGRQEEDC